MANSSIVTTAKNKAITELCDDELFFEAISSPSIGSFEHSSDLLNTHLFGHHQTPESFERPITFVTVETHLEEYEDLNSKQEMWMKLKLEFWIYSHESCIVMENIPDMIENRNDFIGRMIDEKFNGRTDFGYGRLKTSLNTEGNFLKEYLYRRIILETVDINYSLCGD